MIVRSVIISLFLKSVVTETISLAKISFQATMNFRLVRRQMVIDRTYRDDPYEYMSQEPCDYCIELECEHHGVVCPFYKEEKEADNEQ